MVLVGGLDFAGCRVAQVGAQKGRGQRPESLGTLGLPGAAGCQCSPGARRTWAPARASSSTLASVQAGAPSRLRGSVPRRQGPFLCGSACEEWASR